MGSGEREEAEEGDSRYKESRALEKIRCGKGRGVGGLRCSEEGGKEVREKMKVVKLKGESSEWQARWYDRRTMSQTMKE